MELFPQYDENLTNSDDLDLFGEIDNETQIVTAAVNISKGKRPFRNRTARARPLHVRNCYTCYDNCIFKVVDIAFVIGVIANICVIILVLKDKKLRKPTYVAIACLALCDALFLTTNVIGSVDIVVRSLTCSLPSVYKGQVVSTIKGICWFVANAHVSLIALVRYILLLHPFKSQQYLTNKKIILTSACVWGIGIAIWMTIYGLKKSDILSDSRSIVYINVIWGIVYFTPLLITTVLHCRKWRHVRHASRHNLAGNGNLRKAAVRMTKVILLVIILATVLPLPRFVIHLLKNEQVLFPTETVLQNISFLLFLLNHAVNPFVYAFMSTPFKTSLKSICAKNRTLSSTETRATRDDYEQGDTRM